MPKPRPPDASVKSSRSGDLDQKGSGIIARPFHRGRYFSHQATSLRASVFREIWWWGRRAVVLRSIKRLRKMRPAGMIRQAKLSLPIRERSSLLMHFFRQDQVRSSATSSESLSGGKEHSMRVESISIPRNTRREVGPSSLSGAKGMPRRSAVLTMVSTWDTHSGDEGGPTVK